MVVDRERDLFGPMALVDRFIGCMSELDPLIKTESRGQDHKKDSGPEHFAFVVQPRWRSLFLKSFGRLQDCKAAAHSCLSGLVQTRITWKSI